jgi:WD40 repeat protein
VAFTPDGKQLATVGFDNSVKVWDLAAITTGATTPEPLTLAGYDHGLDIDLNPEGTRLAVPTADGAIRIYVLPIEELVTLARNRLTRSWTVEECQRFVLLEECPAETGRPGFPIIRDS